MTEEEKNRKIKNLECINCNGTLKIIKKDIPVDEYGFRKDIYKCIQCKNTIIHFKQDISDLI